MKKIIKRKVPVAEPIAEKGKKKREPKTRSIDLYKQELQMYLQMPEQMKAIKGMDDNELREAIADLEQKITLSKRGKSSRAKGASYENAVAKKFSEQWGIRLVRTPMSGGFQKSSDNESIRGDLSCLDQGTYFKLGLECKKQKKWKLREWYRQAKEDTPEGKVPVVVFHEFETHKEGKRVNKAADYVMLTLEDFMNITDTNKVIIKKEGVKRDPIRKSTSGSKAIKRDNNRRSV